MGNTNFELKFLRTHWDRMVETTQADPARGAKVFSDLRTRYGESHRAYHTSQHLHEMLSFIALYRHDAQTLAQLTAFTFFHDVVYRTDNAEAISKNEVASASYANDKMANMGMKQAFMDPVIRWTIASAHHRIDPASDRDGAFAMDADMMILAARPERYDEYALQIRREYGKFDDKVFYQMRLDRFIQPTLEAPAIFITPLVEKAFGERARGNLRREANGIKARLAR